MYYIGLMSGTSMDAVDVALVEFDTQAKLIHYYEQPLTPALKHQLRAINERSCFAEVAELDYKLGHLFAQAVNELLDRAVISATQISAIGSHGQTVLHKPKGEVSQSYTNSIQIGDPNVIAALTGIPTVADFRRMDMASGGQGAPLACGFHQYQFQQNNKSLVILNIGGIANITLLPKDGSKIIGFDTGPGNALLDDWIQRNNSVEYDKDSQWAKSGQESVELLTAFLTDKYFSAQIPKSSGRDYFNLTWLDKYLSKLSLNLVAEDIQATLLALSVKTISDAIRQVASDYDEVLLSGGGAYNPAMLHLLERALPDFKLSTTSSYGLEPNCIEAVAFAWLAKQRLGHKPANIPAVTGAEKNVSLGGIYQP